MVQDGSHGKMILKLLEGLDGVGRPDETLLPFFTMLVSGPATNKAPVKVREAQEALQFFESSRLWPTEDCGDVLLVHGNAVRADNITKECGGRLVEFTFLGFGIQLMLN